MILKTITEEVGPFLLKLSNTSTPRGMEHWYVEAWRLPHKAQFVTLASTGDYYWARCIFEAARPHLVVLGWSITFGAELSTIDKEVDKEAITREAGTREHMRKVMQIVRDEKKLQPVVPGTTDQKEDTNVAGKKLPARRRSVGGAQRRPDRKKH